MRADMLEPGHLHVFGHACIVRQPVQRRRHPMQTNQIPVPNADFRLEELDDELLLYHPTETRTVYLNPSASLIWRLCDGSRTVADIVALLQDSYPDAEDDIEQQVEATLKQFADYGAVTLKQE